MLTEEAKFELKLHYYFFLCERLYDNMWLIFAQNINENKNNARLKNNKKNQNMGWYNIFISALQSFLVKRLTEVYSAIS